MFVPADGVRVDIVSGGVRHIASGAVRHNGDVIAYLVLIGIAFEGIKRVAYLDVGRPRDARVRAPGIE